MPILHRVPSHYDIARLLRTALPLLLVLSVSTPTIAQRWVLADGPPGGRVLSLSMSPTDQTILAGTVLGGAWLSMTRGSSWIATQGMLPGDSVDATLAWSSRRLLAASDGKLYLSENGGALWTQTGAAIPAPVIRLYRHGMTLLAGTRGGGIYRSLDSGSTWTATGMTTGTVHGFGGHASSPAFAATGAGVFVSPSGGATWVPAGLSGQPVLSIARDSAGTTLAVTASALHRSSNDGQTWSVVAQPAAGPVTLVYAPATGGFLAGTPTALLRSKTDGMAWDTTYAWRLPVLAVVGDSVFAAASFGEQGVATAYRYVNWRWTSTLSYIAAARIAAMSSDRAANRFVVITTGGSISMRYSSPGWTVYLPDTVLITRQPISLSTGYDVWLAGCAGGGVLRSDKNAQIWRHVPIPGSAGDPVEAVLAFESGLCLAAVRDRGLALSYDSGRTWSTPQASRPAPRILALTGLNTGRLVAGGATGGIWYSDDNGATWTAASGGGSAAIRALAFAVDSTGVAATDAGVLRSTDGGSSWTPVPGTTSLKLTSIVAGNYGTWFASMFGSGVYRSEDDGLSWRTVNDGLGSLRVVGLGISYGQITVCTDGQSSYRTDSTYIAPIPGRPTPTIPANGSTVTKGFITLVWNLINGVTFEVQFSTDSSFTTILESATGLTSALYSPAVITNNTRYYWRVRSRNAAGVSAWSPVWSFLVAFPPPELRLNSPRDGTTGVPLAAPLQWNGIPGQTEYRIQVARTPAFDSLVADVTGITDTYTVVSGLQSNRVYWWRGRARTLGGDGPWTAPWSFTTQLYVPPRPVLITPANAVSGVPTSPVLRWQPADNAFWYRVQVATDAAFRSIIHDLDSLTETRCLITGLAPRTMYYWRVLGANTVGEGLWSEIRHFTTDDGAAPPPPLLDPADLAVDLDPPVILTWGAVPGALRYHLQVALDAGFVSTVVDRDALTDTTWTASGLVAGRTHHWRVRTAGSGGIGAWSDPWSFTTRPAPPGMPVLLAPVDDTVLDTTIVLLRWEALSGAASMSVEVVDVAAGAAVLDTTDVTATELHFDRLEWGRRYSWRVRGVNSGGTGPWSSGRTFRVRTIVPVHAAPLPGELRLLALWPQPAHDLLQLRIATARGAVRLDVIDVLGRSAHRTILQPTADERHLSIPLRGLAAGTWLIRLTDGRNTVTTPFVILP